MTVCMKTIGLVGGMSWESSAEYYRIINEVVARRLGGNHSAECLMYSFDFAEIEELQNRGAWDEATARMVEVAGGLKAGGADFLVICTNTMHMMADEVERATGLPLLHIADAAAARMRADGRRKIGLLGTMFTMEKPFYRERLSARHGLEVIVPEKEDRETVHRVIYRELVAGKILPASREKYRAVIAALVARGADAILLACTEIGLLVKAADSPVPLYDTTQIHAEAAAVYALQEHGK
jgi:aspartate racemase